jgi:hypothetical protein
MKLLKVTFLLSIILLLTSCASGYKMINPATLNYMSNNDNKEIKLEYKYNLLSRKYKKKETKKGIKIVAIKITNGTENDLVLGKDIKLTYANDIELYIMDNEKVFKSLKQSTATYLLYLLLTPMNLYTTKTNSNGFQEQTSSTPIGLVVGPGLAAGNMIAAGSANKKFKTELSKYKIYGTTIKKGETAYGLIGIKSDNYDALKIRVE